MNRTPARGIVLALAVGIAACAAADEFVLPVFALNWPGKAANRWSSEIFLTNPGPAPLNVDNGRLLPGTVRVGAPPCYPPIAASHTVPPYSTLLLSRQTMYTDLECPIAVLGAIVFEADGPAVISSRIVNDRGLDSPGDVLAGFGQDVPAFAPADLSQPGVVYQLPGLVWDPFRCGAARFEIYLYLANPGNADVAVTLQSSRDGSAGVLLVNGASVATPYTFTVASGRFSQLKVEPGGIYPTVCMPPQVVDLFFTATGGVAVLGSVADRSSQDARTVLPVPTLD